MPKAPTVSDKGAARRSRAAPATSVRASRYGAYLVHRYYDPQTGQFLTVDPLVEQTETAYGYAGGDPVDVYDLDGRAIVGGDGGGYFYGYPPLPLDYTGGPLSSDNSTPESIFNALTGFGSCESGHFSGAGCALAVIGILPIGRLGRVAKVVHDLTLARWAARRGMTWAEMSGMLRAAARGKGNFGIGSATASDADKLGKAWVGNGYTVASDGRTLVSKNRMRQYRPPSYKPNLGRYQANLEQRFPGQRTPGWQGNAHVDITNLP